MANGPGRTKLGTTERLRKSVQMSGPTNRSRRSDTFSADLLTQYGDSKELQDWIKNNAEALNRPNPDGSCPMSDTEIAEKDVANPTLPRELYEDAGRA